MSRFLHHRSEVLTCCLIYMFRDVQTSVPKVSKLNIFSHAVEQYFSAPHIRVAACLGQIFICKILARPKSVKVNQAKTWRGDEHAVTDGPAAACPGR